MATTHVHDEEVTTCGDLPKVGGKVPEFELVGQDLAPIKSSDFVGKRLVLNIFPSVDTGVCAAAMRRFNEMAAGLDNTAVVCISRDLPFAMGRFCAAEGIDNVVVGSAFRSSFGEDYGVVLGGSPLAGLFARCVIIADPDGTIRHVQLVDEVTTEPDYDEAIAALK